MITENLETLRLIVGDEKIRKKSYGEQLKCLIKGVNYFSQNSDGRLTIEIYILSLFYEQVKKAYPRLSEKQLMDRVAELFADDTASTETNENIKKFVLEEARKFILTTIVKAAKDLDSKNDELYIPANNQTDNFEIHDQKVALRTVAIAMVFIFLSALIFSML